MRRPAAFLAPLVLLAAARAPAQSAGEEPPPASQARLVVSFEQRSRVELLSEPFRADALGATRLLAFRSRLQLDLRRIAGPVGAYVELQDARSGWEDAPLLVRARHDDPLDFTQALLRVGGATPASAPSGLRLGRFCLDLGRRRLVARNGIRNTTNAFDGVHGWLELAEGASLQAFLTRPVRIDPDRLDRSEGRRLFWGASLALSRWELAQGELYALRLDESAATATRRRLTTFGGRLFRAPAPDRPDFELELDRQGGSVRGQEHDASFVHVEGGFSFRRGGTRLAILYDRASGDASPDDDRSGRFDTLFGARGFEYAFTGIYGPFFRANIRGPGVRLDAAPAPGVAVTLLHRALWLTRARDAWFGSGLQDPTGASGDGLGQHLEARLRWRLLEWLLLDVRYARFFKGTFPDRAPGSPRTPDSDFFTLAFDVGGVLFAR